MADPKEECDYADLCEQFGQERAEVLFKHSPRWTVEDMHRVNKYISTMDDWVNNWIYTAAQGPVPHWAGAGFHAVLEQEIKKIGKMFEEMRAKSTV